MIRSWDCLDERCPGWNFLLRHSFVALHSFVSLQSSFSLHWCSEMSPIFQFQLELDFYTFWFEIFLSLSYSQLPQRNNHKTCWISFLILFIYVSILPRNAMRRSILYIYIHTFVWAEESWGFGFLCLAQKKKHLCKCTMIIDTLSYKWNIWEIREYF